MVERKFDGKYSAREKKELEEELDAKAKEWYSLDEATDSARKKRLWNDIFTLATCECGIFERNFKRKGYGIGGDTCILESIYLEAVVYCIKSYDPAEGNLSHLLSKTVSKKENDYVKKLCKGRKGYLSHETSYDINVGNDEGEEVSLAQLLSDGRSVEDVVILHDNTGDIMDELFALAVDVVSKIKTHETPRWRWYRIFYTENITDILNVDSPQRQDVEIRHERDVMRALNSEYLNFYMCRPCESIKDIKYTGLKTYDDIMDAPDDMKKGRMIELPLGDNPAVSLSYLRRVYGKDVLVSSRSNFRKQYKDELRSQFQKSKKLN